MPRVFIQEKVDLAIKNQPGLNFQELQNLLINDSIDMQPYAPNGLLIGVSYLCGGIKWPGSKIGRAYSAGLTGRGVVFTPNFTTDASEAQKEKEVLEVLTSKSQPVPKTPAMLKPFILPAQYGAKEIRPHAAHQTEVTLNSEKYNNQVVNLQIGPAAKVMLLIGGLLAQASVFLIQKILAFLKRLLAAFGFGMRQADLQKYEHPDRSAPALCYEPSQLSLPAPKSAEDKVADELFGVADALEKNDSSLLPVIDGEEGEKARAEVVSAMDDQGGKGTGATTAESENFGFTDEDFTSTNTVSEPPKADPLDELKEALAAHEIAARELKVAEIKNGPIHFSSVDQRQDELKIVREDLESAHTKWDEFCTEHPMTWRLPSAEKARLRQIVVNNELAETRALQSVAAAEAEDARIKKLYATLPAAIVPAAILQAEAQARQAVKTAREAIQVEGV